MSSTLARRIRRIGLLPMTFEEITEEQRVRNEQGKWVMRPVKVSAPVINRQELSLEEHGRKMVELINKARVARKARKQQLAKAA